MIAISKLAALIPFASLALAVPLTGPSTYQTGDGSQCKPNFQGKPVSVFIADTNNTAYGQVLEWSAQNYKRSPVYLKSESAQDSFEHGEFLVEFTGQPDGTYFIKLVEDTTRILVATASHTGDFIFDNKLENDLDQEFDFNCDLCDDSGFVIGCQISSRSTGLCVTPDAASGYWLNGTRLVLGSCHDASKFDVIPQLSASDMAAFNMDSLKN